MMLTNWKNKAANESKNRRRFGPYEVGLLGFLLFVGGGVEMGQRGQWHSQQRMHVAQRCPLDSQLLL